MIADRMEGSIIEEIKDDESVINAAQVIEEL